MKETPAAPAAAPAVDGRRRRGADNRASIVEAMLQLVREGDYAPSAEQVASRGKVSLRTVFRHFEDMDSLYREMIPPIEAELVAVAARPFRSANWRERLLEIVERRSGVFERVAPYRHAAQARRHISALLEAEGARFSMLLREIVRQVLPAEQHGRLLEPLDLLLSFEAWSRLRREQALPEARVREVLQATVRKLTES